MDQPPLWLGILILLAGVLNLAMGVARLRNPDWRRSGWWSRHKTLTSMFAGPPALSTRRSRQDPSHASGERIFGTIQVVVGLVFVIAASVGFVVIFARP